MIYTKSRQDIETFYKRTESKELIIFGASEMAMRFINKYLQNRSVAYFCDNNPEKHGTKLYGIDIVSPSVLADVKSEEAVILIALNQSEEIHQQLLEINKDFDIFSARTLLTDTFIEVACYFYDHPEEIEEVIGILHDDKSKWTYREIIRRRQIGDYSSYSDLIIPGIREYILPTAFASTRPSNEIIIDAGTRDGREIKMFLDLFGTSLSKIYSFEPDRSQTLILEDLIRQIYLRDEHPEITLLPYALSDQKAEVEYCFVPWSPGASFISDNREAARKTFRDVEIYNVKTERLDDVIPKTEKITMIKMDIEGSEYNALLGAKEMIQTHKPRLAISIYHQGADYIRIPKLVKEWVPEYNLTIRHHEKNHAGTVLYAYL